MANWDRAANVGLRFIGRLHFGLRSQVLLLGISGVVVIGAIYLVSLQIEARSQRAADEFGTLALLTSKVSEGLLQGREIATGFLQKPDDKKIAIHNEFVATSVGHLAEIERLASDLPESDPLRKAGSFRGVINSYTTRFSNVVSAQKLIGFNEKDGLQGKLRAAVHTVESQLKKYDQPRLAVLMLMMRRHEKDFMLRGDEKYGDELRKRVDEFGVELAKADLPAAEKAEITKLIDVYKMSFLAYMAGQSTLNEEAEDLAQIYDRLRPSLLDVRKAADDRLETVKSELAQVRDVVFWSICGTVLMAAMMALLVGHWLSTPLLRMAGAMERLAQGDIDSTIKPVNRRDEIGKISKALAVFHEKLLENRRLTAEHAEAQSRAETDRRNAMIEVADGFEDAVSQIVQKVSTASAEIELAAGNLTKTAEATQQIVGDRGFGIGAVIRKRAIRRRGVGADRLVGDRNQPAGSGIPKGRRRSGAAGGADQRADHRAFAICRPHRRGGQDDLRGRRANQSAGAQCHDRGGARR